MREHFKTGTIWEEKVCYSRAVKKEGIIEIAGTTAVQDGQLLHKGDAYEQARTIFEIMNKTLKYFRSSLNDVVRTRMYVRNLEDWEAVTKAHAEYFKGIDPVTTLLGGVLFVDEEMLVEIEATAIMDKDAN
jgi:enamine deaminase RidA (YjgF/YER057c/UK114 family)